MSNENKIESTPKAEVETTESSNSERSEAEGKLLLGKKVLRHFGVRTDLQAGTYSSVMRCR